MWFVISKKIALFKLCYKYVYKGYSLDLIFFVYIFIFILKEIFWLAIPAQYTNLRQRKG